MDGGATIETVGARTVIQPDGDVVASLDSVALAGGEQWQHHLDEIAAWFAGLQRRLGRVARGLDMTRLLTLGALPVIAAVAAVTRSVEGRDGQRPGQAIGIVALVLGAVTLAETAGALVRSPSEERTPQESSSALSRLRGSRPYNVVLAVAPALLAAAAALLRGRPLAAFFAVAGLALALLGMLFVVLLARRRFFHGIR